MSRVIMIAALVAGVSGCKKKAAPHLDAALVGAHPVEAESLDADVQLRHALEQLPQGAPLADVTVQYVGADGTLDASYGALEVKTGRRPPPPPADDPHRKIGAPVAPSQGAIEGMSSRCPSYAFHAGTAKLGENMCFMISELARPHCTIRQVWDQAIAAGAPRTALATIRLRRALEDNTQRWELSVDDGPRDVHFKHAVVDACDPVVEKP